MLLITIFHRHFMINHYFMTYRNFDFNLKLLHDPEARFWQFKVQLYYGLNSGF